MSSSRKILIASALLILAIGVAALFILKSQTPSEGDASLADGSSQTNVGDSKEGDSQKRSPSLNQGAKENSRVGKTTKTNKSADSSPDDLTKTEASSVDGDASGESGNKDAKSESTLENSKDADDSEADEESSDDPTYDLSGVGEAWRGRKEFHSGFSAAENLIEIELYFSAQLLVRWPKDAMTFESVMNDDWNPNIHFPAFKPRHTIFEEPDYPQEDLGLSLVSDDVGLQVSYLPEGAEEGQLKTKEVRGEFDPRVNLDERASHYALRVLTSEVFTSDEFAGAKIIDIQVLLEPNVYVPKGSKFSLDWRSAQSDRFTTLEMKGDDYDDSFALKNAPRVRPIAGTTRFDLGDLRLTLDVKSEPKLRSVELDIPWKIPTNAAMDFLVFTLDPAFVEEAKLNPAATFHTLDVWEKDNFQVQFDLLRSPRAMRRRVPANHKISLPLGAANDRRNARLDEGWPLFLLPLDFHNIPNYNEFIPFSFADLTPLTPMKEREGAYSGTLNLRSLLVLTIEPSYHGLASPRPDKGSLSGQRVELDERDFTIEMVHRGSADKDLKSYADEAVNLRQASTLIFFAAAQRQDTLRLTLKTAAAWYFSGNKDDAGSYIDKPLLAHVRTTFGSIKHSNILHVEQANGATFIKWRPPIGISAIRTRVNEEADGRYNPINAAAKVADRDRAEWFRVDQITFSDFHEDEEDDEEYKSPDPFDDETRFLRLNSHPFDLGERRAGENWITLYLHPYHFNPYFNAWREIEVLDAEGNEVDKLMHSKVYELTLDTKELEIVIDQE